MLQLCCSSSPRNTARHHSLARKLLGAVPCYGCHSSSRQPPLTFGKKYGIHELHGPNSRPLKPWPKLRRRNVTSTVPVFLPFRFSGAVSPLMPIESCCAQSAYALCSACCPLSPLGGGGGAWHTTKKKKVRRNECGEMSVLSDPLSHLGASMSVLRSTPILFLVSYPLL